MLNNSRILCIDDNDRNLRILKELLSADYELECADIVGRKFENVDDHAGYLRDGGCSKIIDVLAGR